MAQRYYTPFTIQSGQVTGTLTNFPALVSFSNIRFRGTANSGHVVSTSGYDLVPYTSSALTTKMDFDRLYYNTVTGAFVDFVRIPSMAVSTTIYYGYGDSSITTDQSNKTAVWPSTYKAVYHFGSPTVISASDSTSNANNLTNNSVTPISSVVHGGAYGGGNWMSLGSAPVTGNTLAVMMWLYAGDVSTFSIPLSLNTGLNGQWDGYYVSISSGFISINATRDQFNPSSGSSVAITANTSLRFVGWNNGVSSRRAYANGVGGTADTTTVTPLYGQSLMGLFKSYRGGGANSNQYNDLLDEVYVLDSIPTDAWIQADYNNQSNQSTFWGTLQSEVDKSFVLPTQLYYTPFTVQSGKILSTLTSWTALVDWTDNRFKSTSNGGHVGGTNGYDLIPYGDSALTIKLDFERELYSPSTGHFIDWVEIPSAAVGSVIYYGYGSTSVTLDPQTGFAAWDNNATLVSHFKDGTTLSLLDAVGNYNGTPTASPTAASGKIDGAVSFNGTNNSQWVEWFTGQILYNLPSFTISCWVNFGALGTENFIYAENRTGGVILLFRSRTDGKFEFGIFNGSTFNFCSGGTTLSTSTWYHLAAIKTSGTSVKIYLNGAQDGTSSDFGYDPASTILSVKTGRIDNSGAEGHYNGLLDELRLANIARNSDWINADYNCQSNQATFWGSLATEVSIGGAAFLFAPLIMVPSYINRKTEVTPF